MAVDTLQLSKDLQGVAFTRDQADVLARELRAEIKEGDASLKVDLVKWIVGSLVLNLVGTAGLMITRIKLIPH